MSDNTTKLIDIICDYREKNADLTQQIASLLSLNANLRTPTDSFKCVDGREFTVGHMAMDVTGERYLRVEVTGKAGINMTCDKFLDVVFAVAQE